MRIHGNLILAGLIFATLFWVIETALHAWVFMEGTFLYNLLPRSINEWWMRSLASCLLFGFGCYAEWSRRRFARLALDHQRIEHELATAREIQMNMLPRTPYRLYNAGCEIAATLTPVGEVGGDLYDFFELAEGRGCFLIGDVSGKGIPAALFMARAKSLVSLYAHQQTSPGRVLAAVNQELAQDNDACMFVTLFLCFIDLRDGGFVYANAGHVAPYIVEATGRVRKLSDLHGPALGTLENLEYSESRTSLNRGDLLFLCTDGLTEAMNESRNLFGEKRLERNLAKIGNQASEDVLASTLDAVDTFTGGYDQFDDICVLIVRLGPTSNTVNQRDDMDQRAEPVI